VKALLMDSSSVIYDTGTITEGIRSALGEYNTAKETAPVTLSGLDEELTTTLPGVHDTLLVLGAAGYAATARAVDRAESFTLGSEAEDLQKWGEARLKEFRGMLGFLFPGYLIGLAGSSSGEDATQISAQVALLGAQAARLSGQESRDAAAAAKALADAAAEAARKTGLRESTNAAWGRWEEEE